MTRPKQSMESENSALTWTTDLFYCIRERERQEERETDLVYLRVCRPLTLPFPAAGLSVQGNEWSPTELS